MIIRCHACHADPAGRWERPPAMVFIEPELEGEERYRCREHVSPAKDEKLKGRERERGWPPGGLR